MKILMLPIQIYDAMQREDKIEAQVKEMQKLHIESKWRNRELGCELEQVMADCKQFKDPLEEAETEKKAILKKYQLPQLLILELEEENDSPRAQEERISKGIHEGKRIFLSRETWRATFFLRGIRMIWIMFVIRKRNLATAFETKSAAHHVEKHCLGERARYEGGAGALLSSIFSVFLSLLVGWQAQDPCIPLVLAVFMIMCMSLNMVVWFLLSLDSGPDFDAVALLVQLVHLGHSNLSSFVKHCSNNSLHYDKI